MRRALTWLPYALLGLALMLSALLLLEPRKQAGKPPDPNAPRSEVLITYEEPADEGPLVGQVQKTIITSIKITYATRINDDQYTEVKALIDQAELIRNLSPKSAFQGPQEPSALSKLAAQVHMAVESPLFKFSDNGNERRLPVGTPTPAGLTWIAQPIQAGEAALTLRLKGVSGLHLSVNGADRQNTGNDDVALPVTVTAMGMSSNSYRLISVIGPVVAAVVIALIGLLGAVLAALVAKH